MTTTQVAITGTTYPIRSLLTERGARWTGSAWVMDAAKWEELRSTYFGANKRGREIARAIEGCEVDPVEG
jgi:hypothetical protein